MLALGTSYSVQWRRRLYHTYSDIVLKIHITSNLIVLLGGKRTL